MRVGSKIRAQELAELARFEAAQIKRPGQRLLLWTGEPSVELSGASFATPPIPPAIRGGGEAYSNGAVKYFELERHAWVVRIQCEFSAAPGKYRIEYVCDPYGEFPPPAPPSEFGGGWMFLAVGKADTQTRLVKGSAFAKAEEEQADYHDQPALFMKRIRVICENDVTVTAWHVWMDTSLDMSGYLTGDLSLTLKDESREEGTFVRSECDFTLADPDGRFIEFWEDMPPLLADPPIPPTEVGGDVRIYYDEDGLTRLRSLSRWTLEVKYAGPEWEWPVGFEGTGYWPTFSGYLRKRNWDRGDRTQLQISLRAGKKATDEKTTQPLHEQITADEFMRDWVTVSDDSSKRLIGATPPGGTGRRETSYEEWVGKTRIFGNNWWESILTLEPPERIHSICSTGTHLVALTFHYGGDETPDFNPNHMALHTWSLVRFDFSGKEVERFFLPVMYEVPAGTQNWDNRVHFYHDLCVVGDKILITDQYVGPDNLGAVVFVYRDDWRMGIVEHYDINGRCPTAIAPMLTGQNSDGFVVTVYDAGRGGWYFETYEGTVRRAQWPVEDPLAMPMPRIMESFAVGGTQTLFIMNGDVGMDNGRPEKLFEPASKVLRFMSFV